MMGVEMAIAEYSPALRHRAQVQLAARMALVGTGADPVLVEADESEDGSESDGSMCSAGAMALCVELIDLDVPERVAKALRRRWCGAV